MLCYLRGSRNAPNHWCGTSGWEVRNGVISAEPRSFGGAGVAERSEATQVWQVTAWGPSS